MFARNFQHNRSKVAPYFQVIIMMCEPTVVYLQKLICNMCDEPHYQCYNDYVVDAGIV